MRNNIDSPRIENAPRAAEPDPPRHHQLYIDFFGLSEAPFSITPDPEFLYLSETHQVAQEKIRYGVDVAMGFMVLTGEVGTGKTTLCRALLDDIQGTARTVYIINPSLDSRELLATILEDLGVECADSTSKKDMIKQLNHFLLSDERQTPVVIIIDDAQTMPFETLEDMRLLSNLETDKKKLIQLLLVGQPELQGLLDHPKMRQLKQRIAINCHLQYLSASEVDGYIRQRLFIAGNKGSVRFSSKAVRQVHRYSKGIPRVINKICDLALTAAYTTDSFTVEKRHVRAALTEIVGLKHQTPDAGFRASTFFGWRWPRWLTAAGILAVLGIGLVLYSQAAEHTPRAGIMRRIPSILGGMTAPVFTLISPKPAALPEALPENGQNVQAPKMVSVHLAPVEYATDLEPEIENIVAGLLPTKPANQPQKEKQPGAKIVQLGSYKDNQNVLEQYAITMKASTEGDSS